ncbi:hypothetical protein P8452_31889 [Trifolium repens]|nr:hypothetical protein P8452_31889 [Trifolium repens]
MEISMASGFKWVESNQTTRVLSSRESMQHLLIKHDSCFDPALAITSPSLHESKEFDKVEIVDKISNPRDGSPALLIHDDGGGMDSEAMRRCMSFGFSDKNSKLSIGQYGNGFKTSSMRLGADAIVFSRHLNNGNLMDIQENGINDKIAGAYAYLRFL